jgi:hypothetical protein
MNAADYIQFQQQQQQEKKKTRNESLTFNPFSSEEQSSLSIKWTTSIS